MCLSSQVAQAVPTLGLAGRPVRFPVLTPLSPAGPFLCGPGQPGRAGAWRAQPGCRPVLQWMGKGGFVLRPPWQGPAWALPLPSGCAGCHWRWLHQHPWGQGGVGFRKAYGGARGGSEVQLAVPCAEEPHRAQVVVAGTTPRHSQLCS